jgi:starch synthase
MFAAADYYLCPSEEEPGGLLPMQASRYGTIPIVSRVGALVDNFAEENAIIIEENGIGEAIEQAFALYANEEEKQRKQKACMLQDFSWDSRKTKYTNLYEG